jgi:hypothetical protein
LPVTPVPSFGMQRWFGVLAKSQRPDRQFSWAEHAPPRSTLCGADAHFIATQLRFAQWLLWVQNSPRRPVPSFGMQRRWAASHRPDAQFVLAAHSPPTATRATQRWSTQFLFTQWLSCEHGSPTLPVPSLGMQASVPGFQGPQRPDWHSWWKPQPWPSG